MNFTDSGNRKWYFENCYGALDDEGENGGLDEDS